MKGFGGIIINIAFRGLVPFTMVYGIYVLCMGESSPGGGFQAGALLAVGILMSRMVLGSEKNGFNIKGKTSVIMAGIGTFIYAFTGWMTLLNGGKFLEYDRMPIRLEPMHEMHALAIFIIEIGVAMCVMMTIINLMDAITKRGDEDEDAGTE